MFQKTSSGLLCGNKKDICRVDQYGKSSCCGNLKCRRPYGRFHDKICMNKNDKSFIDNLFDIKDTLEEENNFFDFNLPNGGIIHLPNGSIINIPDFPPYKLPDNSIIIILPTSGAKLDLPNAKKINIAYLPNIHLPKGSIINIENNIGIESIPKIIPHGSLININNTLSNIFNVKYNTKLNIGSISSLDLDIEKNDFKDFYLVDTIPIDTTISTIDFWNIFNINVCGKKKTA